jgi:hypothetical protein
LSTSRPSANTFRHRWSTENHLLMMVPFWLLIQVQVNDIITCTWSSSTLNNMRQYVEIFVFIIINPLLIIIILDYLYVVLSINHLIIILSIIVFIFVFIRSVFIILLLIIINLMRINLLIRMILILILVLALNLLILHELAFFMYQLSV